MDERNEDYDIYGSFACVYDKFMDNVPYKEWGRISDSRSWKNRVFQTGWCWILAAAQEV